MMTKQDKIPDICKFYEGNDCERFRFRRVIAEYYDKLSRRYDLLNRENDSNHTENRTRMYHGVLEKGVREPVLVCVQDKIAHNFARNDGEKAVGFK